MNGMERTHMNINTLVTEAHQIALDHGWWKKYYKLLLALPDDDELSDDLEDYVINSCLMLMASELGEACEALRNGDEVNLAEELADVVIRVADFCGWRCIDLESAIAEKMEKNRSRPYLHGGKKL